MLELLLLLLLLFKNQKKKKKKKKNKRVKEYPNEPMQTKINWYCYARKQSVTCTYISQTP